MQAWPQSATPSVRKNYMLKRRQKRKRRKRRIVHSFILQIPQRVHVVPLARAARRRRAPRRFVADEVARRIQAAEEPMLPELPEAAVAPAEAVVAPDLQQAGDERRVRVRRGPDLGGNQTSRGHLTWRLVAATPRRPRGHSVEAGRGDTAAATRTFRGDWSRRRRGCDPGIPRRRVAATPRLTGRNFGKFGSGPTERSGAARDQTRFVVASGRATRAKSRP